VLGSAWPGHFNRPLAEDVLDNINAVGLPQWSEADQSLAKAVQRELNVKEEGLATRLDELKTPAQPDLAVTGGSDDIGDVSWNVPTVVLRYPSNIPNLPGHNWSNAIAMATPIAHKGATAGAKVLAMTMVDILTKPDLVSAAWSYFRDEQTKEEKYQPLMRPEDQPALFLNENIMKEYRPRMKAMYFDPSRYATYLEQLGIKYPTVRKQ